MMMYPAGFENLHDLAKRAWRERGLVILSPTTIRDEWDRQHVLRIAEELYGKRAAAPAEKEQRT